MKQCHFFRHLKIILLEEFWLNIKQTKGVRCTGLQTLSGLCVGSAAITNTTQKTLSERAWIQPPDHNNRATNAGQRRNYTQHGMMDSAWLTGCANSRALFHSRCLLFQLPGTEQARFRQVLQISNISPKSQESMNRLGAKWKMLCVLQCLGNEGYRIGIWWHNEAVDKKMTHFVIIDEVKILVFSWGLWPLLDHYYV